jgi:hypothetical protein
MVILSLLRIVIHNRMHTVKINRETSCVFIHLIHGTSFCIALLYRVFRAQADWTLTDTSHKDTEQSTIEASITFNGIALIDSQIRWSPNELTLVCWEIPVSVDKMFWTANKPAQWTLCNCYLKLNNSAVDWKCYGENS